MSAAKPDNFKEILASLERQKAMMEEIKHRLETAEKCVKALREAMEDSRK